MTPRIAVLPLAPQALTLQQSSSIEAALALHGYSAIDAVDRADLEEQGAETERDPRALYVQSRKAFLDFDYAGARQMLDMATHHLLESPRFLPERSLLGDIHLLRAQIQQSEGRFEEASHELQRVALLEPDRSLHPGLFPPDLVAAFADAKKKLAMRSRGALEVTSRPAGAAVYIDGEAMGASPLVADSLTAGSHYVTLSFPQRGTRTRSVELTGGHSTSVEIFVPDVSRRTPSRLALKSLRSGEGDPQQALEILDYLGADVLLLTSADAGSELVYRDNDGKVQLRHIDRVPTAGVEQLVRVVLDQVPRSGPSASLTAQRDQIDEAKTTPSPWIWGGLGLAGTVALLAGGVGLAYWLMPRQPVEPEDRVDIYLGGSSP